MDENQKITHSEEGKELVEERGYLLREYLIENIQTEPSDIYEIIDWTIDNRELTLAEFLINEEHYTIYWRVAVDNTFELYSEEKSRYFVDAEACIQYINDQLI